MTSTPDLLPGMDTEDMTMKSFYKNTRFTALATLLTLTATAPAFADDTELLLVDPTAAGATQPNIMFILDTSGSMRDPVDTTEPYDSTEVYSGSCDTDRLYWTILDIPPTCGGSNNQWINDSAFVCNDAIQRMTGIGAYTGVMVQYHDGGSAADRWQHLQPGNNNSMVECQRDHGVHGNSGSDDYARAGTSGQPFTGSASQALTWGAGDAARDYTIYDGNYLNWRANPVTVSMAKMDILKAVTDNLLNAIDDVNVGVMRFSGNDGGRIIEDVTDINADRANIIATINALNPGGNTPLAETLYESALYWRGLVPEYGNLPDEPDTDPDAFVAGMPGQYQQPNMPVCTRNFNVLISDGLPTQDFGAVPLVSGLPSWGSVVGGGCDDNNGDGDNTDNGECLDDVGNYLFNGDIDGNTPGQQNVITHTIGFAANIPILIDTAAESGGTYNRADNVEQLTNVLMRIVESILDKGLSFTAPAVAVNTFNRTQNLNDLYISTFQPAARVHWPGNIKKYTIDGGVIKDSRNPPQDAIDPLTGFFKETALSHWTVGAADGADVVLGGAANRLPDPAQRRLFTNYGLSDDLTADSNALDSGNNALTLADFGLSGANGEPTLDELLRWANGEDVLDVDNDPATTVRYVMGDPLHSQPAVVVYGTQANPQTVVFAATNDGYLHAINGDTGVELWSFVPKQLLGDLPALMLNGPSTFKHYGIDGDIVPVVADLNNNGVIDGSDFVHLIFGMRRGGRTYFSLDITDKDNPELNWVKTYPEFGQSWSRPVAARVDMDTNRFSSENQSRDLGAVIVIGEGYDTVHDSPPWPGNNDNVGAGISMLDLFSGERIWRAGRNNADLDVNDMKRAIPSTVRVIDFSGDGYADRMYAVDVGGQVFRFDVFAGEKPDDAVTGGVIARFGAEGNASAGATNGSRFYSAPDVSIFTDPVLNRRFVAIGVGSGYRSHPNNTSATDAYYSLRDPDLFAKLDQNAYNNYDVALPGDMVEVSGSVNTVIGPLDRGWKFTFPATMMMLSASATFDNSVFFVAYQPDQGAAATCQAAPGSNILYRVNIANGDPVANNLDTMQPSEADAARQTALQQGGIAPTPAFLFPSPEDDCEGDACNIPPLGCVGVECFDPGFENNPVRTLWTQDGID